MVDELWDHNKRFEDLDCLEAVCERIAGEILEMPESPERIELSSHRYSVAYGVSFVNQLLIKGETKVRVFESNYSGRDGHSGESNGTRVYDLDQLARDYRKSLDITGPRVL